MLEMKKKERENEEAPLCLCVGGRENETGKVRMGVCVCREKSTLVEEKGNRYQKKKRENWQGVIR